jgi:hypothetical protein
LKGKVKITVIATGFGPAPAAQPSASAAQTPVDLTQFGDAARARTEPIPPPAAERPAAAARFAIARRPLLDLPLAAPAAATGAAAVASGSTDPDFDLTSALDVPAFLRRQEG